MDSITKAISLVTAKRIADECGTSVQAVYQWKTKGGKVPPEHCPTLERMTCGQVLCEDLNPSVDWAYLRARKRRSV